MRLTLIGYIFVGHIYLMHTSRLDKIDFIRNFVGTDTNKTFRKISNILVKMQT